MRRLTYEEEEKEQRRIMIKKLICKIFGCIYPEKKLPTPEYLIEMFPEMKDPRMGAFVADLSKPCVRCGKYKKERKCIV